MKYTPLLQMTLARLREFYREPAAVFWVYGFPLLMAMALGLAFRDRPIESISVDLRSDTVSAEELAKLKQMLERDSRLKIRIAQGDDWKKRLSSGKTDLVITPKPDGGKSYEFWDEPNRPESVLARSAVEAILLRQPDNPAAPSIQEFTLDTKGSRYIDFLIPGLLGMNLMGGGLWGVGFVTVDMRVRKLLKRFLATPMMRSDFLLAIMLSRVIFTIPEVLLLLTFGWAMFGVGIQGDFLLLLFLILLGGFCFSGIGLLVASRAKTVETVSGLMNLVMLPMWVVSGVFFSSERFPDIMQPLIQALPLTALINALRAIMLEGAGFDQVLSPILILTAWGGVSFLIALKIFRWR